MQHPSADVAVNYCRQRPSSPTGKNPVGPFLGAFKRCHLHIFTQPLGEIIDPLLDCETQGLIPYILSLLRFPNKFQIYTGELKPRKLVPWPEVEPLELIRPIQCELNQIGWTV